MTDFPIESRAHVQLIDNYSPITSNIEGIQDPSPVQYEYYAKAERQRQALVEALSSDLQQNVAIAGPMQSFKTTLLHEIVQDLTDLGKQVHVYKRDFDNRPGMSHTNLSTRVYLDGNGIPVQLVGGARDIIADIENGDISEGDIVAITEVQFIDEDDENALDLQELYSTAEQQGIKIASEGLDSWFNGEPTKQMQVAIENSHLVAARTAWDDTDPNLVAPMSTRFVKSTIENPSLIFPNGHPNDYNEFRYYQDLQDNAELADAVIKYIENILATGNPNLINLVVHEEEGYALLPSHHLDKKRAIGLDQYKALSVDNYNALYDAAGIDHHVALPSRIHLYSIEGRLTE